MKKIIVLFIFGILGVFLTSSVNAQSCEMPTSCQFNKTTTHNISSFPCWSGDEPIFSTPEQSSGLAYNNITIDDNGGLGGESCGGAATCTNNLILQNPDPSLPVKGLWWRMHDHEESLRFELYACRTALVNGNCTSWAMLVSDGSVDTSGVGQESCSHNIQANHPPGDQGCPDTLPDPKTCHQAADRSNWPCAISFDEHTWSSNACSPQNITAFRIFFKGDDTHAHVADAVWILEGPSCTIKGLNPQATTTLKNAAGVVLQTVTTNTYSFTNLPAGRTYTVESNGATVGGSTLCVNNTTCHTPPNSSNTAFQAGKTRQVINCPANGFVDLNWHLNQPTATPTSTLTPTPTVTPTQVPPTPTPTTVPQMCRQDASITLPKVTTPTPTQAAAEVKLLFKVKFQGILLANIANEAWKTQPVKVTLLKQIATATTIGAQTIFEKKFENVAVKTTGEVDSKGIAIWQGELSATGITPGEKYSILVKGPKHLQRKFCLNNPDDRAEEGFPYRCLGSGTITLAAGDNIFDFSRVIIFAGDLPAQAGLPGGQANGQDGIVNAYDVSLVLNMISSGLSSNANDIAIADMDLNGVVNAKDRSYLVETLEEKYGDEE